MVGRFTFDRCSYLNRSIAGDGTCGPFDGMGQPMSKFSVIGVDRRLQLRDQRGNLLKRRVTYLLE